MKFLLCIFFHQFVSEKIGGAKGTELDEEFVTMEKVFLIDVL